MLHKAVTTPQETTQITTQHAATTITARLPEAKIQEAKAFLLQDHTALHQVLAEEDLAEVEAEDQAEAEDDNFLLKI